MVDETSSILVDNTAKLLANLIGDDAFISKAAKICSLEKYPFAVRSMLNLASKGISSREAFIKFVGARGLDYFCLRKSLNFPISRSLTVSMDELVLNSISSDSPKIYISNHSNIIYDPLLVARSILKVGGASKVPYFVIGNNLLDKPWVENLVKLGGAYSIPRPGSLPRNEQFEAFKTFRNHSQELLSNNRSFWIAQSNGRIKDGDYKTDTRVLQTINSILGNVMTPVEIIPVGIWYQYDPTDYLKAVEVATKTKYGEYTKGDAEDFTSMRVGLSGKIGRIHLGFGSPINFEYLDKNPSKSDLESLASEIDMAIYAGTGIWNINKFAASDEKLFGRLLTGKYATYFDQRVQLGLDFASGKQGINLTELEIRAALLNLYAKPLRNQQELFYS